MLAGIAVLAAGLGVLVHATGVFHRTELEVRGREAKVRVYSVPDPAGSAAAQGDGR